MPTTDFLLPGNNSLDKSSRERYYNLIQQDFGIDMKKELKALKTEIENRTMIARVVGQIREKQRGNKMILQHNIEYGFFRNLLGGCVVASITSVVLAVFARIENNSSMFITARLLLALYVLPIVISKTIVKTHGLNYAKVLFEQYGFLER